MNTCIIGAEQPGDYGILAQGRRATVVQNRGGTVCPDARATFATGRTALEAAQKLCVMIGWPTSYAETGQPRIW
jgi:hypothetical protein